MKKYFTHSPDEGIIEFYETLEEAKDSLHDTIQDEKDMGEGWRENMEEFFVGEITHVATKINSRIRPPLEEIDEDGCDKNGESWNHEYDELCDYEPKEI